MRRAFTQLNRLDRLTKLTVLTFIEHAAANNSALLFFNGSRRKRIVTAKVPAPKSKYRLDFMRRNKLLGRNNLPAVLVYFCRRIGYEKYPAHLPHHFGDNLTIMTGYPVQPHP